jgi:hypothetical protein
MRLLIALLAAGCLVAQEADKTRTGTGVQDPTIDYYDSLADYFRISSNAVRAINRRGIPTEEIAPLLYVAHRSNASPNQLIDARKAGKSWADIAKQYKVQMTGSDLVTEANLRFLSEYHGRPVEQVKALKTKGANFVAINQEFRREGTPAVKMATEKEKP